MLCAVDQKLAFEVAAMDRTLKAEQAQEERHRKRMGETETQRSTKEGRDADSKGRLGLAAKKAKISSPKKAQGIHEPILEPILGQTL